MIWCIKTYIIAYVKTQTIRFIIHYVKPTAQLFSKLISQMPVQNTVACLCLEMVCNVSEW